MAQTLASLPKDLRDRILKQNPDIKKELAASRKKRAKYDHDDPRNPEFRLFSAIEKLLPGQCVREYKPSQTRRFRIDIAFVNERLAIEFDGWEYHGKYKESFQKDRLRQNFLTHEGGWRFLRYFHSQIISDEGLQQAAVEIAETVKQIRDNEDPEIKTHQSL